jgi:hypothetical protein
VHPDDRERVQSILRETLERTHVWDTGAKGARFDRNVAHPSRSSRKPKYIGFRVYSSMPFRSCRLYGSQYAPAELRVVRPESGATL